MSLSDSKEPRKYKVVCFLLLVQIAAAAANGVVKMQTFRAINGYNSTVATCYKLGVDPNLDVHWNFDGHPIDVAADNRFLSSVRIRSGPSTHFYLETKPALSSDNNTAITCQPDGEKESESARLIVYDSAPIVKAIGDGVVTLQENSLFHPQVRIDFHGGGLDLMYSQNGREFQPTPVGGVYGTTDVLLSPIRVDAKMNGPLSIIAYMDGFRFTYDIFRLIVVDQTATATFSPPPSSPSSSYDDDPTMKSIGDSDSSSSAKFTTQAMTPSSTSSNARLREATIAPAKLTPAYLANKDDSSLVPFTAESLNANSNPRIIAGSISGVGSLLVFLLVALVVIHVKSRKETSTSPRRQPENTAAPRERARDWGLAQCEGNSAADSEQRQENNVADLEQSRCQGRSVAGSEQLEADSCVINERDGGGVPTQAADTLLEIQAARDEILHEVQNQGNKIRALVNQQRPRPPEREKECAETMV